MPCPVCASQSTDEIIRLHSIEAAAEQFLPASRSAERNRKLVAILKRLWGGSPSVEIHRCHTCGFGFPVPYAAGDAEFYNLVSGETPHYPVDRWEFHRTLDVLNGLPGELRLLEVGAGDGAFLKALRGRPGGERFNVLALEYDRGALAQLRQRGFDARAGSLSDLTSDEQFDAICMFQTLEHMERVADVFKELREALRPGGHIFISVPHGPSVDQQEELVGLWDMPPKHCGRWTLASFRAACARAELELRDAEVEPLDRAFELMRLSYYRAIGRAAQPGTIAHLINGISARRVRAPLKAALAAAYLPAIALRVRDLQGHTLWVHIQRP